MMKYRKQAPAVMRICQILLTLFREGDHLQTGSGEIMLAVSLYMKCNKGCVRSSVFASVYPFYIITYIYEYKIIYRQKIDDRLVQETSFTCLC